MKRRKGFAGFPDRNAYMQARYMRLRDHYTQILGGQCKQCGSTERLRFSPLDPNFSFTFTQCLIRGHPRARLDEEIKKFELLCGVHGLAKSLKRRGVRQAKGAHGTLTAYRYCPKPKCEPCKKARQEWRLAYMAKKKREAGKPLLLGP